MKDLSHEEMERLLETAEEGVLGLTNDATPYCIPFGFVYINSAVFLSFFPKGRKWDYFQKNSHVCFNVFRWNKERTEWSSVVIDGEMEEVKDMETIKKVVIANMKKMGLDPEKYVDKRMEYYRNTENNPKAIKIFQINIRTIGGKKMHSQIK